MGSTINISTIENYVDNALALVIFAHGAGADKSSEFMEKFTQLLNHHQVNVLRFNFNYMDKRLVDGKRYPPQKMPKLVECFNQVIDKVGIHMPVYLMGKSMGGRVAATLAEEPCEKIKGVVCLGYPFHPQKQAEKLRLEPLQRTKLHILVLQGERDALGNRSEIAKYQLSSLCDIQFFEDGDHNLKPRVKSGFTYDQHLIKAAGQVKKFIDLHNLD